jgi:hypothetical protein
LLLRMICYNFIWYLYRAIVKKNIPEVRVVFKMK